MRSLIIAPPKVPVREVLGRYGIVPRKRFGQNFLHDPAVCRRIVESAGLKAGDSVLEIGPGLGALTRPMLDAGVRVTAVEVDRRIAAYLSDELAGHPAFTLITGDVLDLDLASVTPAGALLVANLPYSITGPVLSRLIENADLFSRAVVMVQKEVALRLTAGAGGKEIGAPAVMLRLLYRVDRIFDVGGGAFLPPPDVASSVLRLERTPGTTVAPALRDAVNRAYRNRRQMLRRTLGGTPEREAAVVAALAGIGHPETARPEDLEPDEWPAFVDRWAGGAS